MELHLNWADYVIVGIILLSTIISVVRGFVREALSLATWVIAFWVAISFSDDLAALLADTFKTPSIRIGLSFFALFAVTLVLGALVNYVVYTLVSKSGLSGSDRLLGVIFGAARGVLVVALLLVLGSVISFSEDPWWKASKTIPHFQPMADWLKGYLPTAMEKEKNDQKPDTSSNKTAINKSALMHYFSVDIA